MADFKTALNAMAGGKLELDALAKQLDKLLRDNPKHAVRLLAQLEEANDQGRINDKAYTELKSQINAFRRKHAAETEGTAPPDPDSTVFARDDDSAAVDTDDDKTFRKSLDDSEDSTEIKAAEDVDSEDATIRKTIDSEDATEIKSRQAADPEDATEARTIRKTLDSEDSTEVNPRAQDEQEDATRPMGKGDIERTHGSVDFDISAEGTDTDSSLNPSTGTGSGWEEPAQQDYTGPGHELGVGDVIKQRFKLLDVLGIGGMGKVFKGIDLLKEEAQDKNPYMAIKLLNEDFKSHPEAFISLQRESSRQQKLAHPNIATVYDFDRIGGRGTPVFITMELMEGQPLNTYIKKVVKKQGGL
ncbi:MAG: protein kinase, partial [Gammaproteobacteria bacterium]